MKRTLKQMQGATLLEVMLVLAIAAMIIVMSIRYYQTAQNNQSVNTAMAQVQAIVAAADGLAQGAGIYTGIVTTTALTTVLTANGMTTPWGSAITVTAAAANTFAIAFANTPAALCPLLINKLTVSTRFTGVTCAAGGNFAWTYDKSL